MAAAASWTAPVVVALLALMCGRLMHAWFRILSVCFVAVCAVQRGCHNVG